MAAVNGAWKAKQSGAVPTLEQYTGALVWGTGINPVHAQRASYGRDIAPYPQLSTIDPDLTVQYQNDDIIGDYADETDLWGYGTETGTSDRPPVGTPTPRDSVRKTWPHWGRTRTGIPGGTFLRSHDHGAQDAYSAKLTPDEDVAQGWRNKVTSHVEDALTSDPSQYEMQTSMTQRDKVRAGSQVPEGRENQFDAPIPSRIPGMKLKVFSGEQRHRDMEPARQDLILRPFWSRQVGTGYREWLAPNEMYVSQPLDRSVPDNPYTGPTVPVTPSTDYGYMNEDVLPYV